jgi:polysaccharide biosynthesis protein PslH
LRYLLDDILPTLRAARPGLTIDVVGSDPSPEVRALAAPGINIIGSVSDVRPHLERAAALIAPLRIGGGTRVKLVEALGLATPVVTTTIGAEGLRLVDREHLRLADTPDAFARAVLEVLDDPDGGRAMGERGLAFARERYTWDRLAARLLEHWQHAAASSH